MALRESTQSKTDQSVPIVLKDFIRAFSVLTDYQIQCILNIINTKQTKIIIESIHNLLYNKTIKLNTSEKSKLKKHSDFLIIVSNKKTSLNTVKTLIARNYQAVKIAFGILSNGRI